MASVMESFGDINNLQEELFQKEELFDRPYYLGIDFSRGTDVIGEITYNGNKLKGEYIYEAIGIF